MTPQVGDCTDEGYRNAMTHREASLWLQAISEGPLSRPWRVSNWRPSTGEGWGQHLPQGVTQTSDSEAWAWAPPPRRANLHLELRGEGRRPWGSSPTFAGPSLSASLSERKRLPLSHAVPLNAISLHPDGQAFASNLNAFCSHCSTSGLPSHFLLPY